MTEKLTTLKVSKLDAAELKKRFPNLRSDAVRLSVLLGRFEVLGIDDLPRPADADAVPVVTVQKVK